MEDQRTYQYQDITSGLFFVMVNFLLIKLLQYSNIIYTVKADNKFETNILGVSAIENKVNTLIEDDDFINDLFPVLKKSCVKDALSSFLPQCLLEGMETISDFTRMETSVKLSICQFKASGLNKIPQECSIDDTKGENVEGLMECMLSLERSTEWWTTYNGYYQNLPILCSSQDSIFQKEQVIKTFMNITRLFHDLNDGWDEKFHNYMEDIDNITEQNLQKFENNLSNTLSNVDFIDKKVQTVFENLENQVNKSQDLLSKDLQLKDEMINEELTSLQDIIENISRQITNLNVVGEIKETNELSLNVWNELNNVMNEDLERRKMEQYEMNLYVDNMKQDLESLSKGFQTLSDDSLIIVREKLQENIESINNEIMLQWLSLTNVLNQDMKLWNDLISDNFNTITNKLEHTIAKIDYMDNKVTRIFKIFSSVNDMFKVCFKFLSSILALIKENLIFNLFFLVLVLKGIPKFSSLNNLKIFWIIIIFGIISGHRFGIKIISMFHQNKLYSIIRK